MLELQGHTVTYPALTGSQVSRFKLPSREYDQARNKKATRLAQKQMLGMQDEGTSVSDWMRRGRIRQQ